MSSVSAVSDLLRAWGRGDLRARDDVLPLAYRELRKRAARYLRQVRPDHTLQPTALVHEAYLRLAPRAWDLLALDEALDKLQELDSQLSQIVELRYFAVYPKKPSQKSWPLHARQ